MPLDQQISISPILFSESNFEEFLSKISPISSDDLHKHLLVNARGDTYLLDDLLNPSNERATRQSEEGEHNEILFRSYCKDGKEHNHSIDDLKKCYAEKNIPPLVYNRGLAEGLNRLREQTPRKFSQEISECPISLNEPTFPCTTPSGHTY